MRFMILVKACAPQEAGEMPAEPLMAELAGYHEQLAQAGVLLDAADLRHASTGWRIRQDSGRRTVIDPAPTDRTAQIAGYTLIQVRDRDEAMAWAQRFPLPRAGQAEREIEMRQLLD